MNQSLNPPPHNKVRSVMTRQPFPTPPPNPIEGCGPLRLPPNLPPPKRPAVVCGSLIIQGPCRGVAYEPTEAERCGRWRSEPNLSNPFPSSLLRLSPAHPSTGLFVTHSPRPLYKRTGAARHRGCATEEHDPDEEEEVPVG